MGKPISLVVPFIGSLFHGPKEKRETQFDIEFVCRLDITPATTGFPHVRFENVVGGFISGDPMSALEITRWRTIIGEETLRDEATRVYTLSHRGDE